MDGLEQVYSLQVGHELLPELLEPATMLLES
jgi:hypothetical protein